MEFKEDTSLMQARMAVYLRRDIYYEGGHKRELCG
jgi:hypothetical protein